MFKFIKIGQKAFKIAFIIFAPFLYFTIYNFFDTFLSIVVLVLVLGSIAFTIYAYISERQRLFLRNEFFKKTNLFFRYGDEVSIRTMPIPVKESWGPEESGNFGYEIIDCIQKRFINSYGSNPLNGTQSVAIIGATDRERPSDSRGFLKISFAGARGAVFSRFITFQVLGKNVVIHLIAFLLGMPKLLDVIYFVMVSPISIWTWVFGWFREEYSIYAKLAQEIDNSFEILDMEAYFASTREVIADCIIDELRANGLYSKTLANNVNNTFNNINVNFSPVNNSVNISGDNSGTVGHTVNQENNGK